MVGSYKPGNRRRARESEVAPSLPLSWVSLLIGAVVVSVSLSDPVIRLSDRVRSNGPIVVSSDNPASLTLASVLPGPQVLRETWVEPVSAEMQASPPAAPVRQVADTPAAEHDAHLWHYLVATAPVREEALGLDRAHTRELQRRLALIGYDPMGFDGVLGPLSRAAVAAWQRDFGFLDTGYFDADQLASLEERSAHAWAEWETDRSHALAMAGSSPQAPDSSISPEERDGCVRGDDGRILGKQSFGCDLKGVKEGLQRLFSKLGDADGPRVASLTPGSIDR